MRAAYRIVAVALGLLAAPLGAEAPAGMLRRQRDAVFRGRACLAIVGVSVLLAGCASGAPGPAPCPEWAAESSVTSMLFFGLAMPDGAVVSARAWQGFLDEVVTPLFPAGFTVLDGTGQYLMQGAGAPIREPARVLILSHRGAPAEAQAIERVRAEYKRRFRQESVLRIDGTGCRGF